MFESILSLLLIIFEVICCKMFYETFCEKKKIQSKWFDYFVIFFLVCFCYLFASLFYHFFIIKQVSMIFLFAITMFFYRKVTIRKTLVVATLYQGLLLAVDYFAFSINSSILSNKEVTTEGYNAETMLVVILGKVILFLCVLMVKKKMGHKSTEILTDTEWIRFLFFPIFTIITVAAMIKTMGYVESLTQARVLLVIACGMAGMNIVVFYLIHDIVEREMQISKKEMFDVQAKSQTNMYRAISENYEKQRSKVHEFKNEMMCIESLVMKKQYDELEKYIHTISSKLSNERDAINVNHVIINAIINTKYQEAINKGIVFTLRVNDLSNIKVKDEDMVVILANLLNNAIEACEKCMDKKIIWFKFLKENNEVILSVKNTYSQPIIYENGIIKTTKLHNSAEHGIGIKNISNIIEKYQGSYVIKNTETEFYFSIMIPN